MRKNLKKSNLFLLNLFLILFMLFALNYNVKADTTTYTDDGAYNYTTQIETETDICGAATYIENSGYTTRSGVKNNQVNHVFKANFNTEQEIKIATWAIKNDTNTGFTRLDLKAIAEDYEKNNPGWQVLAGINADQYYPKFGSGLATNGSDYYYPQPYYPMVSNGENWFTINPYGSSNKVVGFKNDGSTNPLVYGARTCAGFYLYIYDENDNQTGKFEITDLNIDTALGTNETTVLAPYKLNTDKLNTISKQSSNGFYLINNADISYVSNSTEFTYKAAGQNVNAFFGKGEISSIVTSEVSVTNNQFAIETTNAELKEALKVGAYVKAQYDFDSGFDGIEEAIGYHTVQRKAGKDGSVANSYNTRMYPRSIFGADEAGNIYLITCDGSNASPTKGMYAQESNALLKYYGVTDAFQMDGGGSVTAVMRNDDGEIVYAMDAIEGSYRYILSGLFIVMKVPNVSISVETVSQTTAIFNVDLTNYDEEFEKTYIKVNVTADDAVMYEVINGKAKADGLTPNTEYTYFFTVQPKGKIYYNTTVLKGTFTTYKALPIIDKVLIEEQADKYLITVNYHDLEHSLSVLAVKVNGKIYLLSLNDGVGTVSISKDIQGVIGMDVVITCSFNSNRVDTPTKEFELNANVYLYEEYITSISDLFFDKILK